MMHTVWTSHHFDVVLFLLFKGVWEMEGEQLGRGKKRLLAVSLTSDT